ncbi:GNAT family N-acetyltransferase [Streptomyces sp. BE133]|uniref:GNAT family N-acetyltransferase n=1 Tax=Streptomyces sp. BE133 TaxID=3002523 RepID=UPI002E775D2A|nr:GNAT family N-acetyltransferase [Streptomyces sp. BE133]MEE1806698.1 GNAT family N-acetyltransferase [Streptomyces sp. BE133]
MVIEMVSVPAEDKTVLGNLVQLYQYDFSDVRGYDVTPHGTFVYRFLDHYFTEDDREACFILMDETLAGFSMTRWLDDGVREVSEFFVLRRHRRRGAGRTAARLMFRRHPGQWTLAFDHANRSAARFWPGVVASVADGPVQCEDRHPPDAAYSGSWLRFRIAAADEESHQPTLR